MTNRNRRFVSRLLVPLLAVWFGMVPYREAHAIPLFIPFTIAGLNASGQIAIADVVAAGITHLIGGTIVALALIPNDANAPMQTVRVDLTEQASGPKGIAPPNTPSEIPPVMKWIAHGNNKSYWGNTRAEAVADYCKDAVNPTSDCGSDGYCTGGLNKNGIMAWCAFNNYGEDQVFNGLVCPPGTWESATDDYGYPASCTVTDSRVSTSDNNRDIGRTGNKMVALPDADAAEFPWKATPQLPWRIELNGAEFVGSGVDEDGNKRSVTVQPLSTGGSLVIIRTERQASDGTAFVERQVIQVSAAAEVNSASQYNAAQTDGYVDPLTGVYVIRDAAAAGSGTGTDAGSGSVSVTFPSDYARQGEAVTAAGMVTSALDTLYQDLTKPGDAPSDVTLPEASQFEGAFFDGTFSGLLGWSLPAHSSQCPAATLNLSGVLGSGHVYSVDAHCDLIADHFGTLAGAMSAVWTILALFLVLRA